jgi:hypothetical protein
VRFQQSLEQCILSNRLLSMFSLDGESDRRPKFLTAQLFSPFFLFAYVLLAGTTFCSALYVTPAFSEEEQSLMVEDSIVALLAYRNGKVEKTGAGYVVFRTDGAGYVLTNASVVRTANNVEVLPNFTNLKAALELPAGPNKSFNPLPAEVLQIEHSFYYAMLKVAGLNRSVLKFASRFPAAGDTVWSVAKSIDVDAMMTVEKGKVRSAYNLQSNDIGILSHNALIGLPGEGSLLVNECSEIVGLNMTFDRPDSMVRAIDGASLIRILQMQNLEVLLSSEPCMAEVATAKIEAEQVAAIVRQAQAIAKEAQSVVKEAQAEKLAQRDEQSKSLVRETRKLGQTAEQALLKAEAAELESKKALQEFEKQADFLREDTKKLVVQMERSEVLAKQSLRER